MKAKEQKKPILIYADGAGAGPDGKGSGFSWVNKESGEKHIERVFRLYKQYVYEGQKTLGEMNRDQLAKLQAFYVRQGISQTALPVDDLFTNEFVK